MKSLEIPINANINTWDEGLIQSDPSFFEKNSLKYKGIFSNTTYSEGDGMLSTFFETGEKRMNAKEISDATLESVTPAADDVLMIRDTSAGRRIKPYI